MKQKLTDSQLISLYLQNKLEAKDRHALERRALDDPFLSDALDGYQEKNENPLNAELFFQKEMQKAGKNARHFTEPDPKNLQIPISPRAAPSPAASRASEDKLGALASDGERRSGIMASKPGFEKKTASRHPIVQMSRSWLLAALVTFLALTSVSLFFILFNQETAKVKGPLVSKQEQRPPSVNQNVMVQKPQALEQAVDAKKRTAMRPDRPVYGKRSEKPIPAKEPVVDTSMLLADQPISRNQDRTLNEVVVTQAPRSFETKKADSITVIGYVTKRAAPASSASSPGNILAGKASGVSIALDSSQSAKAKPVGGWRVYNAYLAKQGARAGTQAGAVKLSFTLDSLGRPRDIKIEKGVDRKANRMARKLLEQGPAWQAQQSAVTERISLSIDLQSKSKP